MIEEIIKVHDNYQFEIKASYLPDIRYSPTRYAAETYIFIPKSLGIDATTYSKARFYEDVKTYIRLKTPSVLLRNIIGKNSPMEKFEKSIDDLAHRPHDHNAAVQYEYRIKMLCSIVKSSLRDELEFIRRNSNDPNISEMIRGFVNTLKELMDKFRALSLKVKVASIPQNFTSLYSCADEYLGIIANEARHELYEFISYNDNIKKASSIQEDLLEHAKKEIEYREKQGYTSIPTDQGDNETMIFRRSALKKMMGRILFLGRKTKAEGIFAEQLLYGFAAGLAAAIATSFALYYREKIQEFTFFAFIALVIVYIFKDRIKDILKIYFSGVIRKFFADKRTLIYTNLGQKIGILRESFSFVNESDIPDDIKDARSAEFLKDPSDDGMSGEEIMLYRKDIMLISDLFKDIFPDFNINGINDITRINVRHFTYRMDNPEEDVFIPKKNGYIKVCGSRVYQLNIIIKNMERNKWAINKIRIILNRNGIKRIEQL